MDLNKKSNNNKKNVCEICKIPVAGNYMHKHLTSERHLRAKAAMLFYKLRNDKGGKKGLGAEESVEESGVSTHNRVKGIWVLLKDPSTDRVMYKNKLNGKTQANKPLGLREDDIEEETFESFVVENYETVDTGDNQEYEVPEIGQWRDAKETSYWFGGETVENDSELEPNDQESEPSSDSEIKRPWQADSRSRKINPLLKGLLPEEEQEEPEETSTIALTEKFKLELETTQTDPDLIEKPEFRPTAKSSTFQKRAFKGKSLLLFPPFPNK